MSSTTSPSTRPIFRLVFHQQGTKTTPLQLLQTRFSHPTALSSTTAQILRQRDVVPGRRIACFEWVPTNDGLMGPNSQPEKLRVMVVAGTAVAQARTNGEKGRATAGSVAVHALTAKTGHECSLDTAKSNKYVDPQIDSWIWDRLSARKAAACSHCRWSWLRRALKGAGGIAFGFDWANPSTTNGLRLVPGASKARTTPPLVQEETPQVKVASTPVVAINVVGKGKRRGRRSMDSFGGRLTWWVLVAFFLAVLGGMSGVEGEPIPDCGTYPVSPAAGYNARTCGLRQAVDTYINSGSTGSFGLIQDWDVSLVTDMSLVFKDKSNFNADLSKWNVGAVTTMQQSTLHVL